MAAASYMAATAVRAATALPAVPGAASDSIARGNPRHELLSQAAAVGAALLLAVGCVPPQGSDEAWPERADWNTPGYAWPPAEAPAPLAMSSTRHGPPTAAPEFGDSPAATFASSRRQRGARPEPAGAARPSTRSAVAIGGAGSLPGGDACLEALRETGIAFERAPETRGVELPVIVTSALGGVEYWASDRRSLLLDCRLGLALHAIGPILRRHGVTRARFSGAYVFRTTRSGRPSRHAQGLAIDLHDVTIGQATLSVKQHFARNTPCTEDAPLLNRIACDLSDTELFRELLTPDYNRDHHDHFHLAVGQNVAVDGSARRLEERSAAREAAR